METFRHQRFPGSDRFLRLFSSPPPASSGAVAGDELHEDEVFWTIPAPEPPQRRSPAHPSLRAAHRPRPRASRARTHSPSASSSSAASGGRQTTIETLRSLFSAFGELDEAVVIVDKNTGKSKGYGFIAPPSPTSCGAARSPSIRAHPLADCARSSPPPSPQQQKQPMTMTTPVASANPLDALARALADAARCLRGPGRRVGVLFVVRIAALFSFSIPLFFFVELLCCPFGAVLLGLPVVPVLVRLAGYEASPEVMLLAVRAMTYLCDAMPRLADAVVRHGALPILCQRLLAIEYLDVAEQCLQALEKISRKQPLSCLQAGTIANVLAYINFFSTSIQRIAVSIVAIVCKKLPLDSSSLVMDNVPTLCNLLQCEDIKLVETVATCLVRIVDSFCSLPDLLDELCQHGIVQKICSFNHC